MVKIGEAQRQEKFDAKNGAEKRILIAVNRVDRK
jgi:hypothetical protein